MAAIAALGLVVLVAILGYSVLSRRRSRRRSACGRRGRMVRSSRHANAVVNICLEVGAVLLDSGIPLVKVVERKSSIFGDDLVASVSGLSLVELGAVLGQPILGGARKRSAGSSGSGSRSCDDWRFGSSCRLLMRVANFYAVGMADDEAAAVIFNDRVLLMVSDASQISLDTLIAYPFHKVVVGD